MKKLSKTYLHLLITRAFEIKIHKIITILDEIFVKYL